MTRFFVLLATASLCACGEGYQDKPTNEESALAPAALSYDGADYASEEAKLAHGERLSKVLLCTGCHMEDLTGINFGEFDPTMDGIYASNITRVIPEMSDEQLRMLLVKGVHPTRDRLWIMPSKIYQHLSDADLDALIAYLRTVEPKGEPTPLPQLSAQAQAALAEGKLHDVAQEVAHHAKAKPVDLGQPHALGRHITMTVCAECHGAELEGTEDFAPNLDIAGMYDEAALTRLLTTGEGLEGRELELMPLIAGPNLSHMTDTERAAVIGYVKARAAKNLGQ